MKVSYKLILLFFDKGWSSILKIHKIISLQCLQYLKENDEGDFLHAGKHQSFLQGVSFKHSQST